MVAKSLKSLPPSVFVDTWGWLALGHRQDQYHLQVKQLFQHLLDSDISIHTSDYILDELISLLFRREAFQQAVQFLNGIFSAAELQQIQIHTVTDEAFQAAWFLRQKYQDKPLISFTDLTSIVLMKQLAIAHVLTMDEHFIQVGQGFTKLP
jgi:uncharacterized protein